MATNLLTPASCYFDIYTTVHHIGLHIFFLCVILKFSLLFLEVTKMRSAFNNFLSLLCNCQRLNWKVSGWNLLKLPLLFDPKLLSNSFNNSKLNYFHSTCIGLPSQSSSHSSVPDLGIFQSHFEGFQQTLQHESHAGGGVRFSQVRTINFEIVFATLMLPSK